MNVLFRNHTRPNHLWATNPPTPTWFHGTVDKHPNNTWQTWTIADPSASAELKRLTLDGWFIDILPDLNQEDPDGVDDKVDMLFDYPMHFAMRTVRCSRSLVRTTCCAS